MNKQQIIKIYGGTPHSWKRHKNPDGSRGGWVSKCSEVSEDSYISRCSIVINNSRVDNSTISKCFVGDTNLVSIAGTQHVVCWYDSTRIKIGCEIHTLAHWLENYESIGYKNGYSPAQIEEYKRYIDIMALSPKPQQLKDEA